MGNYTTQALYLIPFWLRNTEWIGENQERSEEDLLETIRIAQVRENDGFH